MSMKEKKKVLSIPMVKISCMGIGRKLELASDFFLSYLGPILMLTHALNISPLFTENVVCFTSAYI